MVLSKNNLVSGVVFCEGKQKTSELVGSLEIIVLHNFLQIQQFEMPCIPVLKKTVPNNKWPTVC